MAAVAATAAMIATGCGSGTSVAPGNHAAPRAKTEVGERDHGRAQGPRARRVAGAVTDSVEVRRDVTSGGSEKASRAPAGVPLPVPSVVEDRTGDQDGIASARYSDIVRAEVADRGDLFRFTLDFAGALPDRVGDNENLIAGIGLTGVDGDTLAVMIQGTRDGWKAAMQDDDSAAEVETWRIDGSRVTWSIDRDHVDALGPSFTWGASLKLIEFGDEVQQTGDKAPESGPKTYENRGGRR